VEAKHHALARLSSLVRLGDNNESTRKAATRILMTRLEDPPRNPVTRRTLPSLDAMMPPASMPSSSPDLLPAPPKPQPAQPPRASVGSLSVPQSTPPSTALPLLPIPSLLAPAEVLRPTFDAPPRAPRSSPSSLLHRAGAASRPDSS
jgi:hypothetical protein